ncbi:MAG TPA: hypothetical protein VG735_15915 [Caulobacterales bacterium]|nr:hypothetical protein [Caulobacterales bacterium]
MNKPLRPSPPVRFLFNHLGGGPGGYKEAALLCERLEHTGHDASLVTYDTSSLARYVGDSAARVITPAEALARIRDKAPTVAVFWTNSLFNLRFAHQLAGHGALLSVAVHEPRKKWENVSLGFRARRLAADAMQSAMCAMSPLWLVFSANGERLIRPAAEKAGARLVSLALYQKDYFDETALVAQAGQRNWVCLAGSPGGSSGHEEWPQFASLVKRRFPHLQPVLLYRGSKGNADWIGARDLAAAGIVKNPAIITDAEIRTVFSRSLAVVRLDRSCTQSGTTPVANMAGAPVIGRNIPGISQDIVSGQTGFALDDMGDPSAIEAALATIQRDPASFVVGARRHFTENWGEKALMAGMSRLAAAASTVFWE